MDGATVSLRPDLRDGNVCGVDGAAERVPHGESAVPDVLGSDDGRIRGGYLQVQYRVRGLAEAAAASAADPVQSTGLDGEDGGGAGCSRMDLDRQRLENAIQELELKEEEAEREDEDVPDVDSESLKGEDLEAEQEEPVMTNARVKEAMGEQTES